MSATGVFALAIGLLGASPEQRLAARSPPLDIHERPIVKSPTAADAGTLNCNHLVDRVAFERCAQWEAAEAARSAANAAWWLGIPGLLIGLATLGAAIGAALWARKANQIAKTTADEELRPYLNIVDVQATLREGSVAGQPGVHAVGRVVFRNDGRVRAVVVSDELHFELKRGGGGGGGGGHVAARTRRIVNPGGTFSVAINSGYGSSDVRLGLPITAAVYARYWYEDQAGRHWREYALWEANAHIENTVDLSFHQTIHTDTPSEDFHAHFDDSRMPF